MRVSIGLSASNFTANCGHIETVFSPAGSRGRPTFGARRPRLPLDLLLPSHLTWRRPAAQTIQIEFRAPAAAAHHPPGACFEFGPPACAPPPPLMKYSRPTHARTKRRQVSRRKWHPKLAGAKLWRADGLGRATGARPSPILRLATFAGARDLALIDRYCRRLGSGRLQS